MKFLKYVLIGIGLFFIIAGAGNGAPQAIIIGIIFIVAAFFTKIKNTASDYSSSKAQDELLKLKSLLDQGILTQEEFNKKAQKLKERI